MKRNARKWLRWLFTFALVLGLVSALGLTTLANGGDGTSASQAIEIGTWDDLAAALARNATNKRTDETADSPTYYKLTANCARENSTIHIVVGYGRSVTLDLNGYGIKANPAAQDKFSVIDVYRAATLNLTDSGNTEHYYYLDENGLAHVVESTADENYAAAAADKKDSFTGGYLTGGSGSSFSANGVTYYIGGGVQSYGTFNMAGGTILGNACDNGGGVCNINQGKFTMTGGAILGNTANDYGGGGVFIFDPGRLGSTFIMDGGTISYNSALGDPFDENDLVYGGGVYNFGGTFNMNGGTISYNNASTGGGGVENYNGATFTMTGGTISYNEATYGGGMENNSISTFTMSGGTIEHNTVTYCGGGMANYTNSTFTMSGGTISYNQAPYGGGVENGSGEEGDNSQFIMSGGTISYNTASPVGSSGGAAGGVENCATFTMSGQATVTNNGAKAGAGVVNYAGGTFTMTGGTISYNQASLRSGGVENASKGTFTMTGGTISYNKANSNAGVFNSGATFSMSGGTIAHNEAVFNGGGVAVGGGTFSMSGEAAVSGNKAIGMNGGGVFVSSGTFTMNGGAVSGNTAGKNGGGVYVLNSGAMEVSGGARVGGNVVDGAANNVYLPEGCSISVTDALTPYDSAEDSGARIGVTMPAPGLLAFGLNASDADASLVSADNFFCDDSQMVASVTALKDSVLVMAAPEGSVLIAAAYEKSSGKLADVKSYQITAMNADTHTYTFSDLMTGTDYTCKLMLADASTYAPLCAALAMES